MEANMEPSRIGEIALVLSREEDGAVLGKKALGPFEVVRKIVFVVGRMHDGIVYLRTGHEHPTHNIRINRAQCIPVDGKISQTRAFDVVGRRELLFG